MERIKELELQIKIMANTIDTQEKIIEELKRVLPQADVIKSVCVDCKEEFEPQKERCVACENNKGFHM